MTEKSIDRSAIEGLIRNGATLADIAAHLNVSWDSAQKTLTELGIRAPTQQASSLLTLVPAENTHANAEALIAQLDYPAKAIVGGRLDPVAVYQRFHGQEFVDQYTGEDVGRGQLTMVNPPIQGSPPNILITNIAVLSKDTIAKRFSDWMPSISEVFTYTAGDATFKLRVTRPYDKLVGGTYAPLYMETLFDRWIGQPYVQHNKSDQEVERVLPDTPFEIAWWAWIQITHFGLLKGLSELHVNANGIDVVLTDQQMFDTLLSHAMKDGAGTSNIVMPGSNGKPSILHP